MAVPITPTPELQSVTNFPVPQLIDRHLLVRVSTLEPDYQPVQPGTAHPNSREFPGYFLLREMPIDPSNPSWGLRIYGNGYTSQETWNYQTEYSSGSTVHPIYSREFLELRSGQGSSWPLPKLQPYSGVFDARITARGSGYNQANVTATVTGTGSGCDVLPIVNDLDGGIDFLVIRNPGVGYTGVPTIAFGGGGFGATGALLIQPATCLLYTEEQVRADETNDWMYVRVRRTYETFPGPLVTSDAGYEDETGAKQIHIEQRVVIADTTVPTFGDPYVTTFVVMNARLPADPKNYLVGMLVIDIMDSPESREEIRDGNYPVPDLFVPIAGFSGWPIPAAFPGCPVGPYQNRVDGLDFSGGVLPADIDHRGTYELQVSTPAAPLTDTFSYFIPPVAAPPVPYEVTSQPGKFLPITRNTIHIALTEVFQDGATGLTVVIENLRASTPAAYISGTQVIAVSQKQWKGPFYRRVTTTCEFPALPNE